MTIVGISRSISACKRCRNKKIKCSLEFPKCKACLKANAECVSLDAATGKEIPRSYVHHLEEKIRELEEQLRIRKESSKEEAEIAESLNSTKKETPLLVNRRQETKRNKRPEDLPNDNMGISFSKLLHTAVHYNDESKRTVDLKTNFQTKVDPTSIPISSNSHKVALLPPKQQALDFVYLYFSRSNSQLPIFHRIEFLEKYFIPIYGSIPSDSKLVKSHEIFKDIKNIDETESWYYQYIKELDIRTKDNPDIDPSEFSHSITPPDCFKVPLFFVNIIFAISSSIYHLQFPDEISQDFKNSALLYVEDVYSSIDRLEALQAMLCLTLFSLMRPCIPGVWYLLGSSLRLCVDLNLHNEFNSLSLSLDPFTIDLRRRLFWCCYSLDRQICVYLNRPFGIPEESINVKFFSLLDDEMITSKSTADDLSQYLQDGKPLKSYKHVAIMMILIRQIQAEILSILYEKKEIPRHHTNLTAWLIDIEARLNEWKEKLGPITSIMDCEFTTEFFDLNYYHAKIMLNGLSPNRFVLTSKDLLDAADAAKGIITTYNTLLNRGALNYTWAVTQNVFTAHMSYLYSIFNDNYVHSVNNLDDVKEIFTYSALILESLIEKCNAASQCLEILSILNQAVMKLKYGFTATNKSNETHKPQMMEKIPSENDVQNVQAGGNINDNMRRLISSIPEQINFQGDGCGDNDGGGGDGYDDGTMNNIITKRRKIDVIDPQIYISNTHVENADFDVEKFLTRLQSVESFHDDKVHTSKSMNGISDAGSTNTHFSPSYNHLTMPANLGLNATVSDMRGQNQDDSTGIKRVGTNHYYYPSPSFPIANQRSTASPLTLQMTPEYNNFIDSTDSLNDNLGLNNNTNKETNKEGSMVYKMMFEAGAESIWSQFFAQPFKPEDH